VFYFYFALNAIAAIGHILVVVYVGSRALA